jgi:hypothetical protein
LGLTAGPHVEEIEGCPVVYVQYGTVEFERNSPQLRRSEQFRPRTSHVIESHHDCTEQNTVLMQPIHKENTFNGTKGNNKTTTMKPSLIRSPISFSRISSEEDELGDGIMINDETDTQIEIGENSANPMGSSAFEIEDVEAQEEEKESDPKNGVISPPFNYVCPLTLRLMEEPVYDLCGHAFERAAISDWLEYHNMCPISRRPMEISDIIPSPILQSRIQRWEEEHLGHYQEDPVSGGHMPFECMLLPQERSVLEIIKVHASNRRKLQERRRFQLKFALVSTILILLATVLSMKYLGLELTGTL